MSIRVIGAGFGRTGTLSLKLALEELGFGPCFHMFELAQRREHLKQWEDAINGDPTDWHMIFDNYESTVDFPSCVYYAELLAQYPQAKVILTLRESENWYQSAFSTILTIRPSLWQLLRVFAHYPFSPKARNTLRLALHNRSLIEKKVFEGKVREKKRVIEIYEAHQEQVRNTVPKDQLLEYDVRDGWKPLCDFLAVPIPDTPFPSTNDRGDFKRLSRELFFSF